MRQTAAITAIASITLITHLAPVQLTLPHRVRLQLQQHDTGLGVLEAVPVDGAQAQHGGLHDGTGVRYRSHHRHHHRAAVLRILPERAGADEDHDRRGQ